MFRFILSVTIFIFGVTPMAAQPFGWTPDTRLTEEFVKTIPAVYADDVKSLVAEDTNADALLYRALVPCLERHELTHRLKIRNGKKVVRAYSQGKTGSCVGNATAAAISILNAVEVHFKGKPQEFVAMHSADAMYGLCREAGGSLGRSGDGSSGGAAAKAITQYGTLYQLVYGDVDLQNDNSTRARQYGYRGIGAALKAEAAKHKVLSAVRVRSATEAWALIGNGYPINVCSGQGFERRRDAEGICRPSGRWSHSMAVIGRRTTADGRKLFLIWNSWGDDWARGPYWDDMPQTAVLDCGKSGYTNESPSDPVRFRDADELEVDDPQRLDGQGKRLHANAHDVYLCYMLHPMADLNALELPNPFMV